MRKTLGAFLSLLLILTAVACNNNLESSTTSLTINVSDTATKVIAYDPADGYPGAMSHYDVKVYGDDDSLIETSGTFTLTDGEGSFIVNGLTVGTYTVEATGYINTSDGYIPIATGEVTETLRPSSTNTISIAIDEFVPGSADGVTVSVVMPQDAMNQSDAVSGTLSWSTTPLPTGNAIEGSVTLTNQATVDGAYTLTIDDDIPAGRYVFSLTLTDDNGSWSGTDALIVYPGFSATGTVNLDDRNLYNYPFTVTDGIGNELTIGTGSVPTVSEGMLTFTLDRALGANEEVLFFLDGVNVEALESAGAYQLAGLTSGRHLVTAVVYDRELESAVGAMSFMVDVETEGAILPPIVGVAWDYSDPDPQLYRLYTSEEEANKATARGQKALDDPYDLVTVNITVEPKSSENGNPGSSPFDNLAPWKDMKLVAMADGGEVLDTIDDENGETIREFVDAYNDGSVDFMVELPEAWVHVIDDPTKEMRYYYVGNSEFDGAVLQPASEHYIGRYDGIDPTVRALTSSSELYSRPSSSATHGYVSYGNHQTVYDATHNRNNGITPVDGKTYGGLLWEEVSYVQMMYLVEYANLNSQETIGYGDDTYTSGDSDDMPYHTGVIGAKTSYGSDVQYRYIEGLFGAEWNGDTVENFLADDRVVYIAPSEESLKAARDSGIFNDDGSGNVPSDWINIGTMPSSGWITGFNFDDDNEWSIGVPSVAGGSRTTYASDHVYTSTGLRSVRLSLGLNPDYGAWGMLVLNEPSVSNSYWSARLSFR